MELYTVKSAASLLNVHPATIRKMIKLGALKAAKVGRGHRISKTDLEDYYRQAGGSELFEQQNDSSGCKSEME